MEEGQDQMEETMEIEQVVDEQVMSRKGSKALEQKENRAMKENRGKRRKPATSAPRKVITPGGRNVEEMRKLYRRGGSKNGGESTSEPDESQNLKKKVRKGRKPVKETAPGPRKVLSSGGKYEDLRKVKRRGVISNGGESIKMVRINTFASCPIITINWQLAD